MADVTIKDVARLAGVSTATVSRVINGASGVKQSTVDKVNKVIAETDYIPNATARNLKTDSTRIIGLIVSNISNNHFTSMSKVIDQVLREKGYSVIVCNTEDDPALELDCIRRLMSLQVAGIILNTTSQNDDSIAATSHNLPMVLVDRSISHPNFIGDFVGSNGFSGVKALTTHLIGLGHRDIGIITSNLKTSTGRERLEGFVSAMAGIGVTVDEHYPFRFDSRFFNVEGGIAGCSYLLSRENPPTAIVVANNTMAVGVYKYLHAQRVPVPGRISVASYGNIDNGELFSVEPTYTTLNPDFIGERAARLLLSRMDEPSRGNREVIFEPVLVAGGSTAALI